MQAQGEEDLAYLFLPGRLQVFCTPRGFGSVVLTQARGSGGPGSVPFTQRVSVKDSSVPPPHATVGRMTVANKRDFGDLVVVSFEAVKGHTPLLFRDWGRCVTDLELVAMVNGQKKTLLSIEAHCDVEIQEKRERWPVFHACSADRRWWFVLTVGAEDSWEVKRCDLLLHRSQLRSALGLPPLEPPLEGKKFRLSFFRAWGQVTPTELWGATDDAFIVTHAPSLDDVVGEETLPPLDGVLAVTTREFSFCSVYERVGSVITAAVVERSEPQLQRHNNEEEPKDFGRRLRSVVTCRVDLERRTFELKRQ